MNVYQAQLLNQIIDVNWDIETADVSRPSKDAMIVRLQELTGELMEQMGEDQYHEFMLNGRKMFTGK